MSLWLLKHSLSGSDVLAFCWVGICFLAGTEEAAMSSFFRSATIIFMGATVMAAGVFVVLYS